MIDAVKKLREKTNAGMMDCKAALKESNGDIEKAVEILRKKGKAAASKKSMRAAKNGLVESYIHMGGKIGVLVEVNCETDFVARTDNFKKLVRDVAMQIAAAKPIYVSKNDVPQTVIDKEKEIALAQIMSSEKDKKKPKEIIEGIVESKVKKFFEDACLLEQPFIKDPKVRVGELVEQAIATIGENIVVRRFSRFQLGEEQ